MKTIKKIYMSSIIYNKGKSSFSNGYGDHRIIMMIAVSSLISDGIVRIHEASAVAKSYPNFFEVIKLLGFDDNLELV